LKDGKPSFELTPAAPKTRLKGKPKKSARKSEAQAEDEGQQD
jgi:hypothetical protein